MSKRRTPRGFLEFEHRTDPLLPTRSFVRRMVHSASIGVAVIVVALGIGILGYHLAGGLGWLDSLYNASMILGGMGPVDSRPVVPDSEKWFASFYALFSGIAFLGIAGLIFAPAYHRFIHRFHLQSDEDERS